MKLQEIKCMEGTMTNYIPAEKLIAEIEDRLHCNNSFNEVEDFYYNQGIVNAYKHLREVIISLQQKQSEVDLDEEVISICKTYGITEHLDAELGPLDIENIVRHSYELGFNERRNKL